MKDLLKLPLVIIISMVLAVNRFGDMGCYSMVGDWLVGTVSTSIIPKVNFDYLSIAQCEYIKIISYLVSYAKSYMLLYRCYITIYHKNCCTNLSYTRAMARLINNGGI